MNPALPVEKFRVILMRHDGAMPDIRVDVEAPAAVAPEAGELLRRHVIAGQRQGHQEALAVQGKEQLPAIGMVIGPPDEGLLPLASRAAGGGLLRPVAPAEEIAVADRIVAGVESLALPPELEQAGGHAALIAGIEVDRPPALGRPAHDLDGKAFRLLDEAAIALEIILGGDNQGRLIYTPYARSGQIGDVLEIQFHGGFSPDGARQHSA